MRIALVFVLNEITFVFCKLKNHLLFMNKLRFVHSSTSSSCSVLADIMGFESSAYSKSLALILSYELRHLEIFLDIKLNLEESHALLFVLRYFNIRVLFIRNNFSKPQSVSEIRLGQLKWSIFNTRLLFVYEVLNIYFLLLSCLMASC